MIGGYLAALCCLSRIEFLTHFLSTKGQRTAFKFRLIGINNEGDAVFAAPPRYSKRIGLFGNFVVGNIYHADLEFESRIREDASFHLAAVGEFVGHHYGAGVADAHIHQRDSHSLN